MTTGNDARFFVAKRGSHWVVCFSSLVFFFRTSNERMLDENKDIKVEELEAYSIWLIYNLQNLFNIVGTVVVMRILIVLAVILLS